MVEEYKNDVSERPLVSVCVQTYQHLDFIGKCLDSILSQEVDFDYEILLGEDESTDGTREICLQYAKLHPTKIRLFLHSRSNNIKINGIPTGRYNFLHNLSQAKGSFVAVCEGDDYWCDREKLKKQISYLQSHRDCSAVGCYYDKILMKENVGELLRNVQPLEECFYRFSDVYRGPSLKTRTCTMVYRRGGPLVEFPNWGNSVLSADNVVVFSVLKNGGYIHIMPFVGAVYRVHSTGVWSSLDKKKIRSNMQMNYEAFSKHLLDRKVHKWQFWWLHFKKTYRHDLFNANVKYLIRSLKVIFT